MAKGESDKLTITPADLKSKLERQFLDQYIRGISNVMDNFTFGEMYQGPWAAGYNPATFKLQGGYSGYNRNPYEDDTSGHREKRTEDDTRIEKDQLYKDRNQWYPGQNGEDPYDTSWGGGPDNADHKRFMMGAGGGINPLVLALMSAPVGGGQQGYNPLGGNNYFPGGNMLGGTPAQTSMAAQALTSPMANALTQNLTGNLPKPPGNRG